jgi:hypothetical protein
MKLKLETGTKVYIFADCLWGKNLKNRRRNKKGKCERKTKRKIKEKMKLKG